MNNLLSIIVRTMPGREDFLDKCLFILSGQTHNEIEVVIVAQKKSDADDEGAIGWIAQRWASKFAEIKTHFHASETDARSRSLNIGKACATGRYLAFLDDDDKVYPTHYQNLICCLQKTEFAWGYADTIRAAYNEQGQLISRSSPFKRDGYSFLEHLRGNFIPLHSFVIDRQRAVDLGEIDETMCRLEDYEFLLRLGFRYQPLYVSEFGVEYCIRNDGSNSTLDGTNDPMQLRAKKRLWEEAAVALDERNVKNFGWWVREIETFAALGAVAQSNTEQTYRKLLQEYYNSTSWKLTRPLRNVTLGLRGKPKEHLTIPPTEQAAQQQIENILRSTSWKITVPLRVVKRSLTRQAS